MLFYSNVNTLSQDLYPPSNHFSAQKHYDTNMYLNQLLFRANILDSTFQHEIKQITQQINADVIYRAGPVKTLTRSQTKAENDYINGESIRMDGGIRMQPK